MQQESLLSSAKTKLEALAEYNRKNHRNIGVSSKTAYPELEPFTAAELKCVADKINSDPNASLDIKKKVVRGTIDGSIGPNNAIISYLDTITKKK
jgi:hypothetical protein